MNSKMKNLMLPYMMLASGMFNNDLREYEQLLDKKINVKLDWERKKCKSCKLFPCNDNRHKWRSNPLSQACEKYEKRK